MDNMFSIGQTAKFLGVSTQTLRYYDKIGLLNPTFIDDETGYRYYSFDKFHYIDRIKYLQSFGIGLTEIKEIIQSGNVDSLLHFLEIQIEIKKKEQEVINKVLADMEWYKKYFTYFSNDIVNQQIYIVQLPERYILKVPCYEEILSNMEVRLARKKAELSDEKLFYRRQYGYIIDYDKFCNNTFYPLEYFIYLRDYPPYQKECFNVLPAGHYLCTTMKILTSLWDSKVIKDYFQEKKPSIVLALEFEDNLDEYSRADYEVQFYIGC